jgi:hypothetical protein
MSHVFNIKPNQVFIMTLRTTANSNTLLRHIVGVLCYDIQSFVPFIVVRYVNIWDPTMCTSTECTSSTFYELA